LNDQSQLNYTHNSQNTVGLTTTLHINWKVQCGFDFNFSVKIEGFWRWQAIMEFVLPGRPCKGINFTREL